MANAMASFHRFRLRSPANSIAQTGKPRANATVPLPSGKSAPEARAVVLMVSVEFPFPPFTPAGLKVQAAPAGSPVHESATASLKLPIATTETVAVADWPAFTVADAALRFK